MRPKSHFILLVTALSFTIALMSCRRDPKPADVELGETVGTKDIGEGKALRLAVEKMLEAGLLKNEMDFSITAKKYNEKQYWYFRVVFLPESVDHEFTVRVTFDGKVTVGR